MSDPALKHVLAVRLAHAASMAWNWLREELDQLESTEEAGQVYMAALARLQAYVLHANEVLSKKKYEREQITEVLQVSENDVWEGLLQLRARDASNPTVPVPTGNGEGVSH